MNPALIPELNLLQGGLYGALAILALYNLTLYGFTRSRGYLFYVAFIVSFLLYFWSAQNPLNSAIYPLFFTLNTLAISFFAPSFLNLHQHHSNAFRLFRGYSALTLVSLLAFPLLKLSFIVPWYNVLAVLVTLSALAAGAYYWHQGYRPARFFTLAWAIYISGWALTYFVEAQAYPLGALACIILLGVALADRLTQKQQQDRSANLVLLAQQQHNISQLKEFENLYENSLIGQFQLDKEGYFIKANAAWREILGYQSAQLFEAENPHFDSLFAEHKQRRRFWRNLKEHGQLLTYFATFIQPGTQERIVVSLTVCKKLHSDGAWFGSGQDVSENYLKEQGLMQLQKEKAQSLQLLIAGLQQRIHTPIEKLTQAERYLTQNERTQGLTLLKQSQQQLFKLKQLMNSALIHPDEYPLASIDIRPWLSQWQQQCAARYPQLSLSTGVHTYLIELLTYPDALALVLEQLIANSVARNGDYYEQQNLKIHITLRERGEFLELHYQDNGKRLNQEDAKQLFMPFSTTDTTTESAALGLYQSYNLLTELLQGVIEWPTETESFHLMVRFSMPVSGEA